MGLVGPAAVQRFAIDIVGQPQSPASQEQLFRHQRHGKVEGVFALLVCPAVDAAGGTRKMRSLDFAMAGDERRSLESESNDRQFCMSRSREAEGIQSAKLRRRYFRPAKMVK